MKKITQTVSVLLVALMLVAGLTACTPSLEGTWEGTVNMAEVSDEIKKLDIDELNVTLQCVFDEGKATVSIAKLDQFKKDLKDVMEDILDAELKKQGVSRDVFETMTGTSLDEYLDKAVQQAIDSAKDDMNKEYEYKMDGNKLLIREDKDDDWENGGMLKDGKLVMKSDDVTVTMTKK